MEHNLFIIALCISLLFYPDPDDYTGGSYNMLIRAGLMSVTLHVATLRDNFVEDDENFKATLSLPDAPADVVIRFPDLTFVNITDSTRA